MMVGLNTRFTNEEAASPNESLISVNPNVEILTSLVSRKRDMYGLYDASAF